jgi:hypothetical protein
MSKLLVAPLEALTDPELTDQERRVLLALFSYRGRLTENVWPTREQIGERANIRDLAAIGKRTSSLEKKGWLIKFKKGFSGHMTYTMQFPVRLETPVDSPGQPLEVESTSYALEVKSTSHTRSNPPPHTRCNPPTALNTPLKQTIKQTIYKQIILGDDPLNDLYKEFIDHRIQKKDALSQYKFTLYLKAVQRCVDELNVTPEFVIEKTIEAGWKSVEPSWLSNRNPKVNVSDSLRKQSIAESMDRSWAEGMVLDG